MLIALSPVIISAVCDAADKPVAVLLSQEIPPYIQMLEGFEENFKSYAVQRFFLDKNGQLYSLTASVSAAGFRAQDYTALVAIGPQALTTFLPYAGEVPLLYGLVLNPEKLLLPGGGAVCGVSLYLQPEEQFLAIRAHLPDLSRLGVIYDPNNNQDWFDAAAAVASRMGLTLTPFKVVQLAGQLNVIGDWEQTDALLFIPDRTIVAKSVIQYLIKQALLQRKPVIGYNQFFLDSGAAFSFIFNYARIGAQVADLTRAKLKTANCPRSISAYEFRHNMDVLKVLNGHESGEDP